jgi:hypothetical protein
MKAVGWQECRSRLFVLIDIIGKHGSLENEKGEMVYSIPVEKIEELVGEGLWVGHVFFKGDERFCLTSIGQAKGGLIEINIESATEYPAECVWETCLDSIHATT